MTKTSSAYSGPQPGSSEQTQGIIEALRTLYPHAKYDLTFSNPLELFVATQLAAQCTDERVNAVTKDLFQKYRCAEDYAKVSQEELEQDIKPTGFYRKKAQQIRAACQYLVTHYEGEVPPTMAEMVKIPGVGRKTANVILGNAFRIVEGFIVDTHVERLAQRFGWTQQKDALNIERGTDASDPWARVVESGSSDDLPWPRYLYSSQAFMLSLSIGKAVPIGQYLLTFGETNRRNQL